VNNYARILLIAFLSGLAVLLLPDNGVPVIRLNKAHGPSMIDFAGLILMLLVWLSTTITLIRRRKKMITLLGQSTVYSPIALYLLSIGGIVFALVSSIEWILWFCVVIAFLINIVFVITAFRKAN
jgi:hypothetical protein